MPQDSQQLMHSQIFFPKYVLSFWPYDTALSATSMFQLAIDLGHLPESEHVNLPHCSEWLYSSFFLLGNWLLYVYFVTSQLLNSLSFLVIVFNSFAFFRYIIVLGSDDNFNLQTFNNLISFPYQIDQHF